MKSILLALAIVSGAAMTTPAQAKLAIAPWSCTLQADLFDTKSSFELLLIRGETVTGYGTIKCTDLVGHESYQEVSVSSRSFGIGPAFNRQLSKMTIKAVANGLASVDGMIGQYQLSAGGRYGFIDSRIGLLGGQQFSRRGFGAKIEVVDEDRVSYGLDASTVLLVVKEATKPVITTRY